MAIEVEDNHGRPIDPRVINIIHLLAVEGVGIRMNFDNGRVKLEPVGCMFIPQRLMPMVVFLGKNIDHTRTYLRYRKEFIEAL